MPSQGADGPHWNATFLDFALRVGFDARLCRPYPAQTKGRVESAIKYVRYNFWPTAQFIDLADLNCQAHAWTIGIANVRQHGTTGERPADRLAREQAHLLPVPSRGRVQPFLRDERVVGRDGFVAWDRGWYGGPWRWAGKTVRVAADAATIEIWSDGERLAVHPRAVRPGQRMIPPGQWAGLPRGEGRRPTEPLWRQHPALTVDVRSLEQYAQLVGAGR